MLQEQQEDRLESINVIMDVFSNAIGELNTTADEYLIYIDSDKLYQLKRRMVVEEKMNMSQFINSFLKREFTECYGYYDTRNDKYIFTGQNIVIECVINESSKHIDVLRLVK